MPNDELIRPNAFREKIHFSYFLTIGRALAVAQHFENICRAVADSLDIKCAVRSGEASPTDVEFPDFVERVRKRMLGRAVTKLGSLPGIPDELNAILETARDARNRIAHECTISAFNPFADEEALWSSLELLLIDVRSIATADAIVCSFLYSMNEHEPLLIRSDYVDSITGWVFGDFEGEEFIQEQRNGEQDRGVNR